MEEPWRIESLFELQFFVCPSCAYKNHSKQNFVNHAYNIHPESINQLKSITDNSISDVNCPWNEIEIKEEISEQDDPLDDTYQNGETLEIKEDHDGLLDETDNNFQNDNYDFQNGNDFQNAKDLQNDDCFQCQCCNETFNDLQTLKRHMRFLCPNLDDNNRYRLGIPARTLPASFKNKEEMKECDVCGKKFLKSYMSQHILVHNKSKSMMKDCNICNKSIEAYLMPEHIRQCKYEHKGTSLNLKHHYCEECGKSYSTKGCLKFHINSVHLKLTSKKCDVCGKGVTTKKILKDHMKMHSDNERKLHQCKQCDKKFVSPHVFVLRRHISTIHKGVRFQCETCGMAYKQLRTYREHVLIIHNNVVENYQCTICGKDFATKGKLRDHNNSKHGEKNHICNICNAAFTQRNILVKHDNNVHKGMKNFECKYCEYKCSASENLKRHIIFHHESHKKVQCTQCDRKFATKSDLDRHIKNDHMHQNKCDHCSKYFAAKKSLKRHIITVHEGCKDYQCDQCTMAYGQSGDLKRHMIRAHQNVPK